MKRDGTESLRELIMLSLQRGLIDDWAVNAGDIIFYAGSVTYRMAPARAHELLDALNTRYERMKSDVQGDDD